MFEISIGGTDKLNPYEELIKVFLQPSEYRLAKAGWSRPDPADAETGEEPLIRLDYCYEGDQYKLARQIYRDLSHHTGKAPQWGVLTGIRPVKLAYELAFGAKARESMQAIDAAAASKGAGRDLPSDDPVSRAAWMLREKYLLHPDKIRLTTELLQYQRDMAGDPPQKSLGVYIGIPFCPTRCLYCSFTSNQVPDSEIIRYLEALKKEISKAASEAAKCGCRIESLYMGGGTPTTLDARQLDRLLDHITKCFAVSSQPLREFTVEAGRPDTITAEKLAVLKAYGVDRISINPQSMQQRTLDLIGRKHTIGQTEEAFRLAREAGFHCINTDLIAGLPGEKFEDFEDSLERILALGADNITLHTLAVKRASRLKEMDENYHYRAEELRERMLRYAEECLRKEGFRPYYLYRQKHTSGSTENIGYCREDKLSLYNIRIMEERQSILALGAGGISKVWFPEENRLERVANVSNYEIYIDRIDEMIERKKKNFFGGKKTC